jgi:hypothetical protein
MTQGEGIEQQVKTVDMKVNMLDNKVDKILMVLTGNSMDKDDRGIIGTVNDHDDRITKIERKFEGIIARAIGIGIGLSLMAGVGIREFVEIIFKK